jgi:hypothetical protein
MVTRVLLERISCLQCLSRLAYTSEEPMAKWREARAVTKFAELNNRTSHQDITDHERLLFTHERLLFAHERPLFTPTLPHYSQHRRQT